MLDRLMQHGIGVGGGGSNIESIQSGLFHGVSTTAEISIPISSVDTNKSIIILTCSSASSGPDPWDQIQFSLLLNLLIRKRYC